MAQNQSFWDFVADMQPQQPARPPRGRWHEARRARRNDDAAAWGADPWRGAWGGAWGAPPNWSYGPFGPVAPWMREPDASEATGAPPAPPAPSAPPAPPAPGPAHASSSTAPPPTAAAAAAAADEKKDAAPVDPPSRPATPPTPPESVPEGYPGAFPPPPPGPGPGPHEGPPPPHEHDRHHRHPHGPHHRHPHGHEGPHRGGSRGRHGPGRGGHGHGFFGAQQGPWSFPNSGPDLRSLDLNAMANAFASFFPGGQFPGGMGFGAGNNGTNAAGDTSDGNNRQNATGAPAGGDGSFRPSVDVFDTAEAYVIHASLPGAKKSDLDVSWNAANSSVKITGIIQRPAEVDEAMISALALDERQVGVFEREIKLGGQGDATSVDVDGITAKLEDGILRVEVPKMLDREWTEVKKVDIE